MSFPEERLFQERAAKDSHFRRDVIVMSLLLLLVAAMIGFRGLWSSPESTPRQALVRVEGVANPGWVAPSRLDVHAVLEASGASIQGVTNAPVPQGWTVILGAGGQVRLEPSADLLVFDLPLPVNAVDEKALEALPGIGPSRARAIVEDREKNGEYRSLKELERVRGIGPKTVEAIAPFLTLQSAIPLPNR